MAGSDGRRGRRRRRDGARGPRAADEPRVRASRRSRSPAARCSCRSCPRSRASPASTSCASTRPGTLTEGAIEFDRGRDRSTPDAPVDDALGALAADENRNATATALARGVPGARGLGAHRRRCRSRRPASGAARRSASRARGCSVRRRWCGPTSPPTTRCAAGPTSSRPRAGGCCCSRAADAPLAGEALPAGLDRGRARAVRGEDPARRGRHAGVLRRAGRRAQGDLRRQPAHRRRGRAPGRPRRTRASRSTPASCPRTSTSSPTCSSGRRCSGGSRRTRSGRWSARCSRRGHVVAMTGDGVNDALALKDADIGVAMGNGAPATRAVAQLVLLDGRFATMPGVVAEGRRVIANIERVANLFVTKTVYAMLLAIAVGVARWPYPVPARVTSRSSARSRSASRRSSSRCRPNTRRYVPGLHPPRAEVRDPVWVRRGGRDLRRVRRRRARSAT